MTADAQTLKYFTKRATSIMSTWPSSCAANGETEGINEVTFFKTGEHNSSADLFPSLDREIAVRFNQSISLLSKKGGKNLASRVQQCQWPSVRNRGRFLLRALRGSTASASTQSPPGPRSRLLSHYY